MGISRYLAMTAAEMVTFSVPDSWSAAYMACHFSPYTTGLSNIPTSLPPGSMLILNDRTPPHGHDPQQILQQLQDALAQLHFDSLLLDFERPDMDICFDLCNILVQNLPCPVGVSECYARELDCPLFLPPVPLDVPLTDYTAPWQSREIWLDIAAEASCITVTADGSSIVPVPFSQPPENAFTEDNLYCSYRIETAEKSVHFHLWRDAIQAERLIAHAESLGITRAVGLYQELTAQKSTLL